MSKGVGWGVEGHHLILYDRPFWRIESTTAAQAQGGGSLFSPRAVAAFDASKFHKLASALPTFALIKITKSFTHK